MSAVNFEGQKLYWLPKLFCEWHWLSGNGETDTVLASENDWTCVQLDCAGFDDMLSNALFYKSSLFRENNQSLSNAALETIAVLQAIGAPVPNDDLNRWCLDCSRWTQSICELGNS